MPQDNGNERDAWLDALEKRQAEFDRWQTAFERDLQLLLTAQVLQKDALDRHEYEMADLRAHGKRVDERIDKLGERIEQLVSGIGEFIRRSPVRE